jgi:hypothetical protein
MKSLHVFLFVCIAYLLFPKAPKAGPVLGVDSMPVMLKVVLELSPEQMGTYDGPMDMTYMVPSQAQINRLARSWKKPVKFVAESRDCDDFAFAFFSHARQWGFENLYKGPATLAVGIAFIKFEGDLHDLGMYVRPGTKFVLHALNVILDDSGTWWFFEPQSGKRVTWESLVYEGNVTVCRVII